MKRNNVKQTWTIFLAVLTILLFAGSVFAQNTIGGKIYSGRNDGSGPMIFDGIAPDPPAITDAKVMVQNQHSGGAFITYATVIGNTWSAAVPAGEFVIIFSAPGHDATSREVTVGAESTLGAGDGPVSHPRLTASGIVHSTDPTAIDAYLPPLYMEADGTPSPDELPLANLLVYAFYDNLVNGEPDATNEDPPLNGVTFTVTSEDGSFVTTGVTGTQATITTTDGMVITETDGLYYFTGIPPGEMLVTSDASTVTQAANPHFTLADPNDLTRDWYLNYTEEGGPAWDVPLYPGDPGTEDGGFLVWHSWIEKLDDLGAPGNPYPTGTGTIEGYLTDADKFFIEPLEPGEPPEPWEGFPVPGQTHPGVSLNDVVRDGLVILYTDNEAIPTHPVATAEADPETGYFKFTNVPEGSYKTMMFDFPLDYVWTTIQIALGPGETISYPENVLLVPRFFARGNGYVYDVSTGLPMAGQEVHIRYKSGTIKMEQLTRSAPPLPSEVDEGPTPPAGWTGWYNFDNLPEVEVMGHVDVELPPGYRGAMITETVYPEGNPLELHEDANANGELDDGEDTNDNGILDHYICNDLPNPWPGVWISVPCDDITFNGKNRYVLWFTANYRADLYIEPIPAGVGHIDGYVFNDNLARGSWTGDGVYDPEEERTLHGATVELYDGTGTTLLAITTTGKVDEEKLKTEQGFIGTYVWPADEFGGVYIGPEIGYYEFRDGAMYDDDYNPLTPEVPLSLAAPGTFKVKVIPVAGFAATTVTHNADPPVAGDSYVVAISGSEPSVPANGDLHTINFGMNTTPAPGVPNVDVGVPLAGEIEGGVWDDFFIDPRGGELTPDPFDLQSLMWMEKAGIDHAPVGAYDHLGYLLGVGVMGNALCYAGAPDVPDPVTGLPSGVSQCPTCDLAFDATQKPEMEKRFAPGVHIYLGNDPAFTRGEDLNCDGLLNDGIANPLLDESVDFEDYNRDGDLNDLVNEDNPLTGTVGVLDSGFWPDHPDWGHSANYLPMPLPYTFSQGQFKFEADWSLMPVAFGAAPMQANAQIIPNNAPVINNLGFAAVYDDDDGTRYAGILPQRNGSIPDVFLPDIDNTNMASAKKDFFTDFVRSAREQRKPTQPLFFASASNSGLMLPGYSTTPFPAMAPMFLDAPLSVEPGDIVRIHGANFGDKQAYFQVLLSGEKLKAKKWTDTYIDVKIGKESISGGIVVVNSTGISNAMPVDIDYKSKWAKKLKKRAVYVDGSNTGPEDGSESAPWSTITEALDHLPDTKKYKYVIVAPGVYYENIQIKESRVYLIGFGPRETMINGLPDPAATGLYNPLAVHRDFGNGPVIHIGDGRDGKVKKVRVSGFTITGGTVNDEIGAGIFLDYGGKSIEINSNIIVRNGGYYGGGIWGHYSNHTLRIHSNIIAENGNFGGYAGGISINDEPDEYSEEHGQPEHIVDDDNPGPPPGTYKIYNNLLFHNFSPDYGAAITLYEIKDHLKIFGNVMIENFAQDHGGAVFFEDCGPVDLYSNVFLRNICYDDGGAVSFEDVGDKISHVNIYNNLFAQNIADDHGENHARGGALAFDDTFYARVYNNTIVGNIVAGSFTPAGGGIDSERNGHEYNGADGPYIAPGYSNPEIYNNIVYGNWKLEYDQPSSEEEEEDLDYRWGSNYVWTPDDIHVDNPALQPEWESYNNSDSFTEAHYNDIFGGYTNGSHNIDVDPSFVDPSNFDWHLLSGSPVIDEALYKFSLPKIKMKKDIEKRNRKPNDGMIDMGAFEWRSTPKVIIRIPTGIMGRVLYPVPGEPSPNG